MMIHLINKISSLLHGWCEIALLRENHNNTIVHVVTQRTKKCLQNFNVKRSLTVIVFDEAGLETFQFIARDDCLGLNIYITLKSSRDWKKEKVHFIAYMQAHSQKEGKNPFIISFFLFHREGWNSFFGFHDTTLLMFSVCLVSDLIINQIMASMLHWSKIMLACHTI